MIMRYVMTTCRMIWKYNTNITIKRYSCKWLGVKLNHFVDFKYAPVAEQVYAADLKFVLKYGSGFESQRGTNKKNI